MKILFLSYWGIQEGLTKATVLPHIEILNELEHVEDVWLSTIERQGIPEKHNHRHIPLISRFRSFRFINKIYDFIFFPILIARLIREKQIDFLICRGAPAGALGHKVHKKTGIPYAVESFEPHAEYMRESGVWSEDSLSYRLQTKWEEEQIQTAKFIIAVSENYRCQLIQKHHSEEKFKLAPCAVDHEKFHFSENRRTEIRMRLGYHDDELIGIYVGKFGGLYLDEEAFQAMETFLKLDEKHKILILTPENKERILARFRFGNLSDNRLHILSVDHTEVPGYLSSGDAAFAFYKPSPAKKALSPIKTGEYWSSGLPILIPSGIGDDSEVILKNHIGSELRVNDIEASVKEFTKLVRSRSRNDWARQIMPFAEKYRSFERVKEVYREILKDFD